MVRRLTINQDQVDIESVKTAACAYGPISCVCTGINEVLVDAPETLCAEEAEGEGWLITVEVRDKSELENMMTESQYAKYLEECD